MENNLYHGSEKKKIVIVDTSSGMENEVRDIADANLTASKEELKGVKGFCKKIWKYGLAESYYRNKEIYKVRQKVLTGGNLYAHEGNDMSAHNQAMGAIVDQFTDECEEAVHRDTGEKKEILGGSDKERGVKENIQVLIRNYAGGTLDDAAFQKKKDLIFSELKGVRKDVIDKGCMFADNLLEIAKNAKEAVAHGQKLEELDLDFEVVIGKAKMGARTEAQFNAVDRITEKISSSKIGSFVNEATIASAVALAYSAGTFVSKRMMSSKLAAWGTFGATAGLATIFSGMRESRKLEEERKHDAREAAKGKKFDPDKSPRRKEMAEFRQETRDAGSMVDLLENGLYDFKDGKKEIKSNITQKEFQAVLANLSEIESRVKISDQQKIDLISFSDGKNIGKERLRMDKARSKAKVELRKIVAANPNFLPAGKNFDDLLSSMRDIRTSQLIEGDDGVEKKNQLFKKMKQKKVMQTMGKTLLVGLSIGAVAQEIGSLFQENQEGLLSVKAASAADGESPIQPQHYTVLEYLRRLAMDELPKAQKLGAMREIMVGGHCTYMAEGSDLVPNADGSFRLMRGASAMVDHITFDPNGSLSEESMKILEAHGVIAGTINVPVTDYNATASGNSPVVENQIVDPNSAAIAKEAIVEQGKGGLETHGVHRTLWYDNDTPKPVFDKNELKLHWGGHQGTGVDKNGNYVFNVKHMANDGSHHGKFSIAAQDAAKGGKLKMIFSLSQNTQNQIVEVPIDADGNAKIDPSSEIGKLLFKTTDGHAEFLGKYAEVAEVVGNKEGVDQVRILATHVGHGVESVPIVDNHDVPPLVSPKPVVEDVPQVRNNLITIFGVPPGEAPDYVVDPPPFIPIFGRDPLEKNEKGELLSPIYGEGIYGSNPYGQEDDITYGENLYEDDIYGENDASNMTGRKEAYLGGTKEQENYLEKVYGKGGGELSELANQIPPMSEECKLAINLPAYKEGNIYQTLKEYSTTQIDKNGTMLDSNLFEINVFINRPNGNVSFDDKTISEVERFKNEHPEYKVNIIKKTFNFAGRPVMGKIYKTMADLAVFRNTKRINDENKGRLILRTGGADAMEKNPHFIETILDRFNDPEVAVYKSESRLPLEVIEKFPLLHTLYFMQSGLNRLWTRGKSNIGLGSFSAELYSRVGGFNDNVMVAEEVELAKRMRNEINASNGKYALKKDLVKNAIDDPRRYIWALYNNIGMARAYNKFGDKSSEDSLRNTDWIKKVTEDRIPDNLMLTKENLERELRLYYGQYLRSFGNGSSMSDKDRERAYGIVNNIFSRMLTIGGISKGDYEFVRGDKLGNSSISIKSISNLENLIKNRKFASHNNFV